MRCGEVEKKAQGEKAMGETQHKDAKRSEGCVLYVRAKGRGMK